VCFAIVEGSGGGGGGGGGNGAAIGAGVGVGTGLVLIVLLVLVLVHRRRKQEQSLHYPGPAVSAGERNTHRRERHMTLAKAPTFHQPNPMYETDVMAIAAGEPAENGYSSMQRTPQNTYTVLSVGRLPDLQGDYSVASHQRAAEHPHVYSQTLRKTDKLDPSALLYAEATHTGVQNSYERLPGAVGSGNGEYSSTLRRERNVYEQLGTGSSEPWTGDETVYAVALHRGTRLGSVTQAYAVPLAAEQVSEYGTLADPTLEFGDAPHAPYELPSSELGAALFYEDASSELVGGHPTESHLQPLFAVPYEDTAGIGEPYEQVTYIYDHTADGNYEISF
jgi:hypothetical protein